MPFVIREATAADTEPLTPLIRAALQEQAEAAPHRYTPTPDFEMQFRRWLGKLFEDPRSIVLIAFPSPKTLSGNPPQIAGARPIPDSTPLTAKTILGYLLASVQKSAPIFHPPEYALIHHLYVLPAYRRLGVADRLVAGAVKVFSDMDIPQLRVETYAHNAPARHFFESVGFHPATLSMTLPLNSKPRN